MKDLDRRMLSAHAAKDHRQLVRLYAEAAEKVKDLDAACFYLTHAYVFALEAGSPEATALHARLKACGRET